MPIPGGVNLRVQEEGGFGLIELLIAIVMLNIGILAIVAAFNSGAVALRRASHIQSATPARPEEKKISIAKFAWVRSSFSTSRA